MEKKLCILLCTFTALIYLVLAALLLNRPAGGLPEAKDTQRVPLRQLEQWEDGLWKDVSLPCYVDMSGEARFRAFLTYEFSANTSPSLIVQANHTFMTFYLNGEEIYSVEDRPLSLGNYFARIPLPVRADGDELEICIRVPARGLQRIQIPEMIIADEAVFLKSMIGDDLLTLILNLLIFFCAAQMFLMALIGKNRPDALKMLTQGVMALNFAVYLTCETCVAAYLFPDSRIVYYTDMLSFSMLAAPVLFLIGYELKGWLRAALNGSAFVCIANTLFQSVVAVFQLGELRVLLSLTHLSQALAIVTILACLICCLLRREKVHVLYAAAPMMIGGAIDLVLFLAEQNGVHNVYFLKIGFVIYMLQQICAYIHKMMERSAQEAQEVYYKYLALRDPLTGCFSRLAYEIDKNDWHGKSVRTVFSMDLNDLKTANDQFGHDEGDRLLGAFGVLLDQTFAAAGKCYRVGGDEFLAFCDGLSCGQRQELLEALEARTAEYNQSGTLQVPVSYAIGASDTRETHSNLEASITLSDERMYENKRTIKKNRETGE